MATILPTNFANAFETTLAASFGPTDLEITVQDTAGGPPVPCVLVLDPENPSQREYILFDGDRTGTTYQTTSLSNRYLDGSADTSDLTHGAGTIVRMAPVAQHFQNVHARINERMSAAAHAVDSHSFVAHNDLTGLTAGDPHTQYMRADGTRHDNLSHAFVNHGDLSGLDSGDDHPQYARTDGTRELTGNQSMGGNRLTNLGAPSAASDAAQKTYVDDLLAAVQAEAGFIIFHGDDPDVERPEGFAQGIWVGSVEPNEMADGDVLEMPGPEGTSVEAYTRVDGSRPFTAPIAGVAPTAPEHLTTREYVDAQGVSGQVTLFAGDTAPDGWLLCDGSNVSRTTYADLFAVIGTTYGAGDGTSTFGLPNLHQRFPRGTNTANMGSTGGANTHTHNNPSTSNTGAHAHNNPSTGNAGAHSHNQGNTGSTNLNHTHGGNSTGNAGSHSHNTGNASAGHTHGGPTSTGSVQGGAGSFHYFASTVHGHGSANSTSHSHNVSNTGSHSHNVGTSNSTNINHGHSNPSTSNTGSHAHSIGNTGNTGDHSHSVGSTGSTSNVPPYVEMRYIIKT